MQIVCRMIQIETTNKQGIATIKCTNKEYGAFSAMGYLKKIEQGERYILSGAFIENGCFTFQSAQRTVGNHQEAMDILMDAGLGINEEKAAEITKLLGDDIFAYADIPGLETKLLTIKGIGTKKAASIKAFLKSGTTDNEAFCYLLTEHVPYAAILSFFKQHPREQMKIVKSDPYSLMRYGASFSVCDRIAMKQRKDAWDLGRIRAAVNQTLMRLKNQGDTRVEWGEFLSQTKKYLYRQGKSTIHVPERIIAYVLKAQKNVKMYTWEGVQYIAPFSLYQDEQTIVQELDRINQAARPVTQNVSEWVDQLEQQRDITYNTEQKQLFRLLETGGIYLLTGGPGTGKTTTIGGLVELYRMLHPEGKVLLCAPTGRAASRMAELSNVTAKTMHKAMNLKWFDEEERTADTLDYDLIIADEMSMCDTALFATVLQAVRSGALLCLSGDYNQLSSVGPGQVFKDLVECGNFTTVRLIQTIRQGEGSLIAQNAAAILNGETIKNGKGFRVLEVDDDETLLSMVKRLKLEQLPQILCPVKKKTAGTEELNLVIQTLKAYQDKGTWIDNCYYHKGDQVIMNSNRYDIGYMNGDVGAIEDIYDGYIRIKFTEKTIPMEIADTDGMSLSYALTVHKSQGAEAENVLIVLPTHSRSMRSKQLLYTAVTRAKKNVTILSVRGLLDEYIAGDQSFSRETGLKDFLQQRKTQRRSEDAK